MAPESDSYDEVPYVGRIHFQSHVNTLATVARLFGMSSADPQQSRVLEIGCADGSNLITMAFHLPQSTFVGIDGSAPQIARGQSIIDDLSLENVTLLTWGPRPKQLPPLIPGNADVLGFGIAAHQLTIIVVTPLILAAVWLFLNRTRTGLALRAVSQNEDASLLAGLNVPMMYALAFALSAVLAGLAGVFFGGLKFMSPTMGTEPLVKALVVVIFGGVANLTGPILAAYLIAFFEAVATYFIGFYWTPALLFLVLIVTLMVRPEGLLTGRSRRLT